MRCSYCGVEVTTYPASGICTHCGGKLPDRPAGIRCNRCGSYSSGNFCSVCGQSLTGPAPAQPAPTPVPPVYVPYQQPVHYVPGVNCCPRCRNTQLTMKKRGFSWGWGIAGFFLIPGFGALLGLIGRNQLRCSCQTCGHKWTRD